MLKPLGYSRGKRVAKIYWKTGLNFTYAIIIPSPPPSSSTVFLHRPPPPRISAGCPSLARLTGCRTLHMVCLAVCQNYGPGAAAVWFSYAHARKTPRAGFDSGQGWWATQTRPDELVCSNSSSAHASMNSNTAWTNISYYYYRWDHLGSVEHWPKTRRRFSHCRWRACVQDFFSKTVQ